MGDAATEDERKWLGQFRYADNDTYLHWDEALMPRSKAAWTSWNYLGSSQDAQRGAQGRPVFVTYWLNKLQALAHPTKNVLVSLNPTRAPDPAKTWRKISYAHPQFSPESVRAQRGVARELQGRQQTYFCGAWMGYGFHEDGFRSGIEVAMALSGVPVPWVAKWGQQAMIPAPKTALAQTAQASPLQLVGRVVAAPLAQTFERFCRAQLVAFLRRGFEKGRLTLLLPNGEAPIVLQGRLPGQDVAVQVRQSQFFVRLALEADLGLARSYVAGEWEVAHTGPHADGLTRLLQLLLDNMPTGQTKTSGGFDASQMVTAWLGSALNALWFRWSMDNSIANSRSHIHAVSSLVARSLAAHRLRPLRL